MLINVELDRNINAGSIAAALPFTVCAAAAAAGASQVDIRYDLATAELAEEAHMQGLRVMAWCRGHVAMEEAGIKSDESYQKLHSELIGAGCDVICTNCPELPVLIKLEWLWRAVTVESACA